MRIYFLILSSFILTNCASNSGVVQTSPETYMVSRQASTGFGGLGSLKADAFKEANDFCASKGRTVNVKNTNESKPPYILGNFPRAEIEFMCVQ